MFDKKKQTIPVDYCIRDEDVRAGLVGLGVHLPKVEEKPLCARG